MQTRTCFLSHPAEQFEQLPYLNCFSLYQIDNHLKSPTVSELRGHKTGNIKIATTVVRPLSPLQVSSKMRPHSPRTYCLKEWHTTCARLPITYKAGAGDVITGDVPSKIDNKKWKLTRKTAFFRADGVNTGADKKQKSHQRSSCQTDQRAHLKWF